MIDRWSAVPESAALAHAGRRARRWPGEPVAYALGRGALVVVVDAGDRPDGSGVRSRDELVLHGPFPDDVAAWLADERDRPTLGFVRTPEGCVAVGRLQPSALLHHRDATGACGLSRCRFHLPTRLPYDVLDQLRPTPPAPPPDLGWLDLLPEDAVGALREFVTGWYADLPADAALTGDPAEPALPAPLLAFYRAAAGRRQVLDCQNRIFPPGGLERRDDGLVMFGAENQGVFRLLMDPTDADPAVLYEGLAEHPLVKREPLSGYLLQFALSEAAVVGPYVGWASVGREDVERLVEPLRRVPLRPMRWPGDPTEHHVGPGVVAMVCGDDRGGFEVFAGARHAAALRPLREPGFGWEYFTG